MEADYELYQTLGYIRSCGFMLACLFVGVAAVVAGAKLKKSVGVWIFAVSTIVFAVVTLLETALSATPIDFDIQSGIYVLTSMVSLVLNVAMLVGMALIKPVGPGGGGREVREG